MHKAKDTKAKSSSLLEKAKRLFKFNRNIIVIT